MNEALSLEELIAGNVTEDKAIGYIANTRWSKGHHCPFCSSKNKQAEWKTRCGQWQCRDCRRVYSVRAGTILAKSRISLKKWLHGLYLIYSKELGPEQLSNTLNISLCNSQIIFDGVRGKCELKNASAEKISFQNFMQEVLYTNNIAIKYKIERADYRKFLKRLPAECADLILTDPPYAISRQTGFQKLGKNSVDRFAVSMDFGEWDQNEIDLKALAKHSYRTLRKGGTIIVFYDLWKITLLANALTSVGFKQLRLIEWKKSNPVPLNSKRNYLTNSREVAVLAVKNGKPTFHGEYDNGEYIHPIPNNGKRYHSTQKPLKLFIELIKKHSNTGDVILDPFLGSGTTAVASYMTDRKFAGCDINDEFINIAKERIDNEKSKTPIFI